MHKGRWPCERSQPLGMLPVIREFNLDHDFWIFGELS